MTSADTHRGTANFHEDGETIRRSVTVRRPLEEVQDAWKTAGIPGKVSFRAAAGDQGIEVHVLAPRDAQSGASEILNALRGDDPGESLSTALRKFKARLETGEVATVHGQPSGRESGRAETPPYRN